MSLPHGQYIIRLKDEVDIGPHIQLFHQAYNNENITGFSVVHQWTPDFFNAYVGELHPEVLAVLRDHQDIAYISENSEVTCEGVMQQQKDACWGTSRINRNAGLSGKAKDLTFEYNYDDTEETGKGVDIYIVDTGIYLEHEDFGGRARWGTNTQKNTKDNVVTKGDYHGHGTHVAGIAGGKQFGVAKAVSLIDVKVTNDAGKSVASDMIDGLKWVLGAHKKSKNKQSVVNMSMATTPWNEAVNENATKLVVAGIHFTACAANYGSNARDYSPASAAWVNTVGATDISDKKWDRSNWGRCVDFFAPGVDITSCGIAEKEGKDEKKERDPKSKKVDTGTSMAAPHVAGIIATFISLHGNLEPLAMTHVLKLLAIKIDKVGLLARGALHVGAKFKLVSNAGVMQISNNAIFSKIKASILTYDKETSKFTTKVVACEKGKYGTHEFPLTITSAYNFLDLMLRHGIDGDKKDDKKGTIEVKILNVTMSIGSDYAQWEIFKYQPLKESTSTPV